MSKPVPAVPHLDYDRKQAKTLLKEARLGNTAAIERFYTHHPMGLPREPRLSDAQLVIAREYGFPSWPKWKAFVETRRLARQEQIDFCLKAICSNDFSRGRVLLQADPALARESFHLACACGELGFVTAALEKDPGLALRPGGVSQWEPLLYACHSRWLRVDAERSDRIVEIARQLLAHGADSNAFYMTDWMDEKWKETALFGASGIANNPALTKLLLDAGADVDEQLPPPDPNDYQASPWGTETLYHTSEFQDTACLGLVLAARPHPWRVSYCLSRALDFENEAAVHLYLRYGADPNFVNQHGDNHLRKAIVFGRSLSIIQALVEAGADITRTDLAGLTPYQHAVRQGRLDIAQYLGRGEVSREDRALAALLNGSAAEFQGELEPELLCHAARKNEVAVIHRLLDAGAAIDACDKGIYGTPPLHWAAWRGRFEAVQALVERGADIHWRNPYGGNSLGTAIHGSANCFDLEGGPMMCLPEEAIAGGYVQIVELLAAAGAELPDQIWGGSEEVQDVLRRLGVPDSE